MATDSPPISLQLDSPCTIQLKCSVGRDILIAKLIGLFSDITITIFPANIGPNYLPFLENFSFFLSLFMKSCFLTHSPPSAFACEHPCSDSISSISFFPCFCISENHISSHPPYINYGHIFICFWEILSAFYIYIYVYLYILSAFYNEPILSYYNNSCFRIIVCLISEKQPIF